MIITTEEELEKLKEIGRITALARDEMAKAVRVGITTKELDGICESILRENGASSAPKISYNFPGWSCISVNEVCAHGIPSNYQIKDGDFINIDVSAQKNGIFADTGLTIVAGESNLLKDDHLMVSYDALLLAIEAAKPGTSTANIGKVIFKHAMKMGYTVLRNLTGHGIGYALHEEPHYIYNYNERQGASLIKENMVLALETFISNGDEYVEDNEDGSWPLYTENKSQIVQFEHTIVIRKEGNIIVTESEFLKGRK